MKHWKISYRKANARDAEKIVAFYNYVGGETTYLSFEKDEYPMGSQEQAASITSMSKTSNNIMLIALDQEDIVGIATISSSHKIKARHEGELGIVVAQKYHGHGIGSELMKQLLDWARSNEVTTRVRLDTRADNTSAVSLYLKFGFIVEGCCKNSARVNGQYYDLYVMGMML